MDYICVTEEFTAAIIKLSSQQCHIQKKGCVHDNQMSSERKRGGGWGLGLEKWWNANSSLIPSKSEKWVDGLARDQPAMTPGIRRKATKTCEQEQIHPCFPLIGQGVRVSGSSTRVARFSPSSPRWFDGNRGSLTDFPRNFFKCLPFKTGNVDKNLG